MFQKDKTFDVILNRVLENKTLQKIGNLYPTYGLGPVAQYMSLARKEDNFNKIVSLSSPSKGRYLMAKKYFDKDHNGIIWNLEMVT